MAVTWKMMVLFGASMLLGAGSGERFSLPAMSGIVDVSGAVISFDGRWIAYVASRNVMDRNTSVDQLHVYDLRASTDRVAPFSHESYANLQWSRDDRLAFIADDAATKSDQLFVTGADVSNESRLTAGSTDVLDAAWRRDGAAIAFIRREGVAEKRGAAAYRDAFDVGDNAYLVTKATQPAHLWTVTLGGTERRITSGSWSIRDASLSWSADDRSILYDWVPNGIYGIRDRSVAERIDVASGARRRVTGHSAFENQAVYGPDGHGIAFLYPRGGVPQNETEVSAVRSAGGVAREVTRALDRHVEDFAWYDATHILVRVYDHTRVRLYVVNVSGGSREVSTGAVRDAAIDDTQSVDGNGAVVFTGSTGTHPNELYYLPPHAAPRMLTHFNDPVASLDLGRQTEFHWTNGGFDEYGVVTYPPGYDARKRYPLVLRIHGGPTETSTLAFEPFYQLAAARGYIVLAPNYRGSSDDGNAFEYAIYNDASIGPGSDIMAAILALERTNAVDSNRIGVSGWSYGGQLTTWMIARYHIWRAAVTGAGVNDLVVDYAIADDYDDALHAFPGPPHAGSNLARWRKQSPMSYVESITTPTLILCNVYDVRVPIVESYELYRALRDRAVPVKFYAYPSTGHLPHGPVRLADAYAKWLNWFDRFLHPSQ